MTKGKLGGDGCSASRQTCKVSPVGSWAVPTGCKRSSRPKVTTSSTPFSPVKMNFSSPTGRSQGQAGCPSSVPQRCSVPHVKRWPTSSPNKAAGTAIREVPESNTIGTWPNKPGGAPAAELADRKPKASQNFAWKFTVRTGSKTPGPFALQPDASSETWPKLPNETKLSSALAACLKQRPKANSFHGPSSAISSRSVGAPRAAAKAG
mmetsp:Transcript_83958/g.213740  ORF Transcript_83958/g.213740 Transcript_83958/m.213740 type:complete len:207 (-) Transcript_83958:480-1100(-)